MIFYARSNRKKMFGSAWGEYDVEREVWDVKADRDQLLEDLDVATDFLHEIEYDMDTVKNEIEKFLDEEIAAQNKMEKFQKLASDGEEWLLGANPKISELMAKVKELEDRRKKIIEEIELLGEKLKNLRAEKKRIVEQTRYNNRIAEESQATYEKARSNKEKNEKISKNLAYEAKAQEKKVKEIESDYKAAAEDFRVLQGRFSRFNRNFSLLRKKICM